MYISEENEDGEFPLLPTPTTMDDLPVRTPEQIRAARQIGGVLNLREVIYYLATGEYDEVYQPVTRVPWIKGKTHIKELKDAPKPAKKKIQEHSEQGSLFA